MSDRLALRLDDRLLAFPSGVIIAQDRVVGRFPGVLGFGVELVLARCEGRALAITTPLRQLLAVDLESGAIVWRAAVGHVSGLAIVHAEGRPLLGCTGVAKWGGGARRLFDLASGAELDESALGRAFLAASPAGHYFGDANHAEHYAIGSGEALVLHRASDGKPIRRVALEPDAGASATTRVTETGARVTEFAIRFDRATRVWFGPDEFVVTNGKQIHGDRYDHERAWQQTLPAGEVRGVAWVGEDRLVLAESGPRVDLVRVGPAGVEVIRPDCEGLAIVEGELLTGGHELVSLVDPQVRRRVSDPPTSACPRVPGPLPIEPPMLELLAKLRVLGKDRHEVGLEVEALERVEAELGVELPTWALGLLALGSRALARRWQVELASLVAHRDELARLDVERRAQTPSDPAWPAGLVVLGKRVSSKKVRSRGRRIRATWTYFLCALGDECLIVERLGNLDLDAQDELVPDAVERWSVHLTSPRSPLSFVAELVEELEAKGRAQASGPLTLALR